MMKKSFLILSAALLTSLPLFSQSDSIGGKPIVEIYTDFHANLNTDDTATTGFNVSRAYFGYGFTFHKYFTSAFIIDMGTPADLASGSKPRRYAYMREASVGYAKDNLTVNFGITGTSIFSFQQKFWGKRYIANTYQAINGYGYVADLGVIANYRFSNKIEGDIAIMNGEGFSSLQLDNSLKYSAGLTVTPAKMFALRFYGDIMKAEDIWQSTLIGFAGFRNSLFYIGAEISYKSNLDETIGHHAWGISSTGGISLTGKLELFTRYDYSTSVVPQGETEGWNKSKDGSLIITGLQYTFNKAVKAALDYQTFLPADENRINTGMLYLNLLFKF